MTRGLKSRIKKVEGLYYLGSINKGADQLHHVLIREFLCAQAVDALPLFTLVTRHYTKRMLNYEYLISAQIKHIYGSEHA